MKSDMAIPFSHRDQPETLSLMKMEAFVNFFVRTENATWFTEIEFLKIYSRKANIKNITTNTQKHKYYRSSHRSVQCKLRIHYLFHCTVLILHRWYHSSLCSGQNSVQRKLFLLLSDCHEQWAKFSFYSLGKLKEDKETQQYSNFTDE